MAFDGFVTHSIVRELSQTLVLGKIDKIYQPEKDEIIISVRTASGVHRLLISAASSNPRIHLTEESRENPITAPLFCMILRKHLSGGKIISFIQQGFDRVIRIDIECYTEMGDLTVKSLIVEIMGRHSNIILIQEGNRIIDSVKHIDFTVSAVRQILPNLIYELPPSQDKSDPKTAESAEIAEKIKSAPGDMPLDKILLSEFIGMSPLMAREIVYRYFSATKVFASSADADKFSEFAADFIRHGIIENTECCVVFDSSSKKPVAFSCVRLSQYEGGADIDEYASISRAVETFFSARDMHDRLTQKAAGTVKLINNNIERCEKKIAIHSEILENSKNRERYKIYGDLLTANLYRMQSGESSVTVQNFYSDSMEDIKIEIKPELTPSKNAQRYYKMYAKSKAAEQHSTEQLKEATDEKNYLESVLDSVQRAADYNDIAEIRDELAEQGYISAASGKKKNIKKKKASAPMKFISSDGYTILVGRNNKQNDELTVKMAFSTDIWLHTKNIPGSHTIIRANGEAEVPEQTITEAAMLAAYFSKAQNSAGVPVDYTQIKNVKKPSGAKPGFVIYETNYTAYVTPDEKLVEKLKTE